MFHKSSNFRKIWNILVEYLIDKRYTRFKTRVLFQIDSINWNVLKTSFYKIKSNFRGNFKWPSITNGDACFTTVKPLKPQFVKKNWNKPSIFWLEKCLFLWIFPLLLIYKEYASHFRREIANEKEQKHWNLIHIWSDKPFKGCYASHAPCIKSTWCPCVFLSSPWGSVQNVLWKN